MTTKAKYNGRQMVRQMKSDEEIWRSRVSGYFMRTKKPILAAIEKYEPIEVIYKLNELIPLEPLYELYLTLYGQLGYKYYKAIGNSLNKSTSYDFTTKETIDPNDPWWQSIEAYINSEVATRITGVVGVTRQVTEKAIRQAVSEAIEQGLSIEKTKKLIEKSVNAKWIAMRRNRSRVIARTEVLTASNHASYQGAINTGLNVRKAWLHYLDKRTRPDHAEMDSTNYIGLNEYFNVGGYQMLHPGATGAPAKEVVNCRCVCIWSTD